MTGHVPIRRQVRALRWLSAGRTIDVASPEWIERPDMHGSLHRNRGGGGHAIGTTA